MISKTSSIASKGVKACSMRYQAGSIEKGQKCFGDKGKEKRDSRLSEKNKNVQRHSSEALRIGSTRENERERGT